jgi:hypothetical protein
MTLMIILVALGVSAVLGTIGVGLADWLVNRARDSD